MLREGLKRSVRLLDPLIHLHRSQSYGQANINLRLIKLIHTSSSLSAKNYYETLGVARNSSQKDIKKAYYQLAKKYHPDSNKGDPESAKKFQEVSEAYEVLSDETKRRDYDAFGSKGANNYTGGGTSGFQGFHSSMNPEELFRKIFGEYGYQNFNSRTGGNQDFEFAETDFGFGAAQEVVLNITFREAARGCDKQVKINILDTCPTCSGKREKFNIENQSNT